MLPKGLLRDVTEEEVIAYERDGVVRLPGILAPELVEQLGRGIDHALGGQWQDPKVQTYDASATADELRAAGMSVLTDARAEALDAGARGKFVSMIGANTINTDIRELAVDSPLPYIAGRLFRAKKVNFYDDQTLSKEPSTREYTAFHTDEPYYHLSGEQVCGMWVSPDVVTEDSGAMRYVRGSHRWGTFFKANVFVSQTSIGELMPEASDEEGQVQLPDIEGNPDAYDIVTYTSNPGDVIVHHSNLIHGSGPNYTADLHRRAVSFRYAGDDVRYRFHRSAPPQPHHSYDLKDGDRIDSDQFPVVWTAEAQRAA